MSSCSEWFGRHQQNTRKFLDTRPHRDAGHHTETVKRQATVRMDRRPTGQRVVEASTYTDFVGGVEYRTATAANTKAPQISMVCTTVAEPPPPKYTNPAVLKGLGYQHLANCPLAPQTKAYDATCVGCCSHRTP